VLQLRDLLEQQGIPLCLLREDVLLLTDKSDQFLKGFVGESVHGIQ